MRRVVVTGMGIVSPVGVGVDFAWKNITEGKSGLSNLRFEAPYIASQVAGLIPLGSKSDGKLDFAEYTKTKGGSPFIDYAGIAAQQAIEDSNILDSLSEKDFERFGVNVGAGIGGLQQIYENSNHLFQGDYRKISPFFIPSALINLSSGHISIKYGLKGPNISLVTACSTGTHSIMDAYRMILSDDADFMIAGSSEDPVNPIGVSGFDRMRALSTSYNDAPITASRPWDKGRDGFVIAEGSGMLVLEELEHAKKRGAHIYAEIVGYGMSGDASHMTAPLSDGNGAARCMNMAIKKAGINASDIDYVNAHGTSTPLGDKAELSAIRSTFGSNVDSLSISSTKSATGHLLGAAGAIEAIFTIKSIEDGIVPPTLNLNDPDEVVEGLDLTPLIAKEKKINYALSNSFGFGGTNGTVIFKKFS